MRIQFSSNRTTVLPVVRITSESNPSRHASDRAPLVSGPHSTRSTINSQRAAQSKLPAQPTILTRPRDPSQGGMLLEDTPQVRRHAEEQLIAPRTESGDATPVHHQPLGRPHGHGAEQPALPRARAAARVTVDLSCHAPAPQGP